MCSKCSQFLQYSQEVVNVVYQQQDYLHYKSFYAKKSLLKLGMKKFEHTGLKRDRKKLSASFFVVYDIFEFFLYRVNYLRCYQDFFLSNEVYAMPTGLQISGLCTMHWTRLLLFLVRCKWLNPSTPISD